MQKLRRIPTSSSSAFPQSRDHDIGVTGRIFALCLLLAVFFGWIIPLIDVKLGNTFLGAQHLAPGAVGTLLVLLLVLNPLLRVVQVAPARRFFMFAAAMGCAILAYLGHERNIGGGFVLYVGAAGAFFALLATLFAKPLSRNEMLTTYISCLFSCIIPGHGSENYVLGNLVAPFYFATPENKWLDAISAYIPAWASPVLWADPSQLGAPALSTTGRAIADNYYLGIGPIPWTAWLIPMLFWMGFILLSYILLGCLSVILRAQWVQNEALSFPLNQLPLELTEDVDKPSIGAAGQFFRNPLTWMGFGLAALMQGLNGLNQYLPDVPIIQWNLNSGALFNQPPWNQMGWTPMQIYPIAIGIAFLLTSEIGFSLWFFALFMRFQFIASYFLGMGPNIAGGHDFVSFQTFGAFFAYAALVIWTGRLHYFHIVKRALGRARPTPEERNEVLSYPLAFWGFVLSLAGVMAITHLLGVNWTFTCLLWATYLVMCIGLTRLVVEGGLLYVGNQWWPFNMWAQLTNASAWLPVSSAAPAALVQSTYMLDMRAFLLPSFMQGWKLAYDNGLHVKRLATLIGIIILIALALGFYRRIDIAYNHGGALTWHPHVAKNGVTIWAKVATGATGKGFLNPTNAIWAIVGALLTWGMLAMRVRYAWFPLHPLGYLIPLSYPMMCLWFPIFIGWSCKVVISKYGGNSAYQRTRPLFLGLAFGDISMMLFWLLVDGWLGRTFHSLVPS